MEKRTLCRILIMLVLLTLTGCTSIQTRVTSCQQMLANSSLANNRIPRKERQVLMTLNEMSQGHLATSIPTAWPCKRLPPCQWYGVFCTSKHVTAVSTSNLQVSGEIPPTLGDLSELEHLSLGASGFTGEIPVELGNLSRLEVMALFDNRLTGEIPSELGNLSQLHTLSLFNNLLSGPIPSELGNLSQLEYLIIERNRLSGEIPLELGNLSQLEVLALANNRLSGEIPPELGNLSQLWCLELDGNQLSGEIPPELGNLSQLERLHLNDNQLSGPLPDELLELPVKELYLSGTDLCVPRTAEFEAWIANLEDRDFEDVPYCD
jgi:Leucine-rich repeat (LRR) protein